MDKSSAFQLQSLPSKKGTLELAPPFVPISHRPDCPGQRQVDRSREDFLEAVARYAPGESALAEALLAQATEGVPGRFILDLPALAQVLSQPILEVEEILNRWDRANLLVFRGFERGYVIWPTERLWTEPNLGWDVQPMSAHQAEKEAKLERMITDQAYIEVYPRFVVPIGMRCMRDLTPLTRR